MDNLNFWLSVASLAFSVIVLAAVIVILEAGRSEKIQRDKLIAHLLEGQKAVTRTEYLKLIADVVDMAKFEIIFVASAVPRSQDESKSRALLEEAKRKALARKLKKYQAIIPKEESRLSSAWELKKSDIKVLVHEELGLTDLNFTIADKNIAVVGVPDKQGGPSTQGFIVHSATLINLLINKYNELESKAESLEQYAVDTAYKMQQRGFTIPKISERTGIELEFLNSHLPKSDLIP